jgi:uncharacterized protein YigE (DUF2233 family)
MKSLVVAWTISLAAQAHAQAGWRPIGEGIAYARRSFDGTVAQLYRVDLERARVHVTTSSAVSDRPRAKVAAIVEASTQVLAVNASFFDERDRPIGLVIDGGQVRSPRRQRGWSALVVSERRARIVLGTEVNLDAHPELVVQGFPRLVVAKQAERLKPQVARRTAVCADGSTLIVVVTESAEFNGFARFLAAPEPSGAGCTDALNFDGGPSTQLEVRLPGLTRSESGQPVPNALVILPGIK